MDNQTIHLAMQASLKRTKIIATVGPASNTKEMLLQFAISGANTFRLNFSHGTHADHLKVIKLIRAINKESNFNVATMQDLQGPKIRIGTVENNGVEIVPGQELIITTDRNHIGTSEMVSTSYEGFAKDVKVDEKVLIDDGRLEVQVIKVDGSKVHTRVVHGGLLKSRKGMNLPDSKISAPCLTEKDLEDLEFGLKNDVDWVAISFVRSHRDIDYLRSIIKEHKKNTRIIAKIERPEALKDLDGIIDATDAVMVARGDLGVETSLAELPVLQKDIMKRCFQKAKPVIVATQMLESMVNNPIPTRAEANDVAAAVMEGADAVMLSEESAAGKYPLQAVKTMNDIIRSIELSPEMDYEREFKLVPNSRYIISKEVIQNACILARATKAKAIVGMTESGFTAFHLAKHRPKCKILIFTKDKGLLNTLNLVWGVKAFYLPKYESISKSLKLIEKLLINEGCIDKGDLFINIGSVKPNSNLKTNLIKIGYVDED
ncbi:pyruvate kinase [Fulvitalea axinellae]|uniref:Pyruvate kinase n=1 Tax=Fulvitalea axinellae TaxID=1182444 RepID=A0AAU9CXM5_9BACT|nr:pyruvate kinase [Fulvitalea axinellae]